MTITGAIQWKPQTGNPLHSSILTRISSHMEETVKMKIKTWIFISTNINGKKKISLKELQRWLKSIKIVNIRLRLDIILLVAFVTDQWSKVPFANSKNSSSNIQSKPTSVGIPMLSATHKRTISLIISQVPEETTDKQMATPKKLTTKIKKKCSGSLN